MSINLLGKKLSKNNDKICKIFSLEDKQNFNLFKKSIKNSKNPLISIPNL